jgi:acetyltransferase-like isoleucine patch superfamily enzyme
MMPHDWFPRPLPDNVELGEGSWLYSSFAFVHYRSRRPIGVRVGRRSGLYNGTFFDLGPDGEVEIGDYCAIVGAIIATNRRVTIGDYAFIAHEVVIADHAAATPGASAPSMAEAPHSSSVATHASAGRGIVIGENAWIGARAVLLDGARIGRDAVVGAAAVIDFDVPAGAIAAGNPARLVGTVARR